MMPAAAPWTRRNGISAVAEGAIEQHGAEDEQADRAGEELPRAITATEPAGQGRHHSRGAEIARHDPGAEIDTATQALLELRQCHIGDGGVESLHSGRDHQRDRYLPAARTR